MNRPLHAQAARILCGSIAAFFAMQVAGPSVRAMDVHWDITPGTVGVGDSVVTGGTGTWDTTLGNWTTDAGANNIAWNNATHSGDTAVFGGTAGTVTLGAGISVGGMTFNDNANYVVTGSTITLGGTATITTNVDATIKAAIASSAGLTKEGAGVLTLTSPQTYIGETFINHGTLNLQGEAQLGVTANLTLRLDATKLATLAQNSDGTNPVTTDGQPVGFWNDLSVASDHDASITTTGKRPVYTANALNGKPALTFSSSSGQELWVNYNTNDTQPFTIAFAYRQTSLAGGNHALFGNDNGGWDRFQGLAGNANYGISTGGWQNYGQASYMNNTDLLRYVLVSKPGVTNGSQIWIDGVMRAQFTENHDGSNTAQIALANISPNNAWNGNVQIGEVLAYSTALDSAGVAGVDAYLRNKWVGGLGGGSALPGTTTVTMAANTTLDVNGSDQQITALSGPASTTVALGTGGILTVSGAVDAQYDGVISGAGTFRKAGLNTLTLGGVNTHSIATEVNAGILAVGNDTALGGSSAALNFTGGTLRTAAAITTTRPVSVAAGGGVFDTNGFDSTLSGTSSGAGTLIKTGSGTLSLLGASTMSGAINVTGGRLVGNTGSLKTPIVLSNNASVTFDQGSSASYLKAISGAGSLLKEGAGVLTLKDTHTYTGATVINAGTLKLQVDIGYRYYKFLTNTVVNNDGTQQSEIAFYSSGTNNLNGVRVFPVTAIGDGGAYHDSGLAGLYDNNLGSKSFYTGLPRFVTFDFGVAKTFTGYNWATANDLTPNRNPHNWQILGSNDNSIFTLLDTQTGQGNTPVTTATWAGGWALPAISGSGSNLLPVGTNLTMDSGTTLDLNGVSQQIASLHDAPGASGGHQVLLGTAKLTVGDANNTTFAGSIAGSGAASLEKTGGGALNLDGTQSYNALRAIAGTTNVNGVLGTNPTVGTAVVTVDANASLNFGSVPQTLSSLTIGAGAIVTFTSGFASHQTTLASVYYQGGLSASPGAWAASNGTASNWTTDGAGTATPLTPGGGTNVIFSDSAASNQGSMTLGAHMAVNSLTVVATETNPLELSPAGGFTLTIGSAANSGITVSAGAGAVTLNSKIRLGADQSWINHATNPLTIGGTVNNNGSLLTVAGEGNTFILDAISGSGGLTKNGAGTLTLGGRSTYSGPTTLTGGVLIVNADAALGAAAGTVAISTGAILQAAGDVTATNRTLSLGTGGGVIDTNGSTVTFGAGSTITGTALTRVGAGALDLNGTQTYASLTASAGTTNVNAVLGSGSAVVAVNGTGTKLKFGSVSQALGSLTIGAGATVTFTSGVASGAFSGGGGGGKAPGIAGSAAVPEPGTLGLLLVGALGMLNRRRRQA